MSVLKKLDEVLDRCEELSENQKKILAMLKPKSQETLKKEIQSEHVSGVDLEKEVKEEVEQDFTQVLVTAQSDKALLVVKKGFQQWLAKSLIVGEGNGYDDGNIYDIEIKEISPKSGKPTKWVFKKWEVFKVVKNRG